LEEHAEDLERLVEADMVLVNDMDQHHGEGDLIQVGEDRVALIGPTLIHAPGLEQKKRPLEEVVFAHMLIHLLQESSNPQITDLITADIHCHILDDTPDHFKTTRLGIGTGSPITAAIITPASTLAVDEVDVGDSEIGDGVGKNRGGPGGKFIQVT